jgi:hypothetical protein
MGANLLVSRQHRPPQPFQLDTNPPTSSLPRLVILVFLLAGCRLVPHRPAESGHLEAKWSGSDGGKISAPASAEWCAARRLLEIRAVQGDTGFALALYPRDTLVAGRYRVIDPLKAESLPPAAGVALRWFTQNAVKGFQGDTGTVFLDRSPSGELGGSVSAGARSVVDTQRVTVKGTFEGLTVRRSPGCDTVVH